MWRSLGSTKSEGGSVEEIGSSEMVRGMKRERI